MNLSSIQIEKLIKIAESGDNFKEESYFKDDKNLSRRLLHGKVLIDRWNLITISFIFNTCHKNYVNQELITYDSNYDKSLPNIWGADISFYDEMPEDKILVIGEPYIEDTVIDLQKCTAVIPMIEYLMKEIE
jgi:hypothetical protein